MPGSLIGPFEGRVEDADTGQPIADALVWCSWSFQRGIGNASVEAVRDMQTRTNADGRYRVPALTRFPQGLSTRLARFSFVVYKKGYVAYRHDRVFGQPRRRTTFSQLNNHVRVSRWSPELSHAEHLLFVGVAPPLLRESHWEVEAAVAELEGKRVVRPLTAVGPASAPTAAARGLDASVLLSSDDVRAVTGYTGAFKETRLAGKRTDTYDTFHLRASDRPERYDVAIRVWRLSDDDLVAKYEEVLNKLPDSKQTDEIADRSFTVQQGEILGLGFMDRARSTLVLLTCGKGQCPDVKHLTDLGRKVERRLGRLPPVTANPPTTQPETNQEDED